MSYFPALLDLKDKKILVVGGGEIAYNKVEKLISFTSNITIVSIKFKEELIDLIDKYKLNFYKRAYLPKEALEYDIVIVAVDNLEIQKEIFKETRESRVLVNSVDSKEFCDFIFPSFIKKGDLIISFSTSGISPALSKYLRRYFESLIPSQIERFLEELKVLRNTLPKGKERMKKFDLMAKEFVEKYLKRR